MRPTIAPQMAKDMARQTREWQKTMHWILFTRKEPIRNIRGSYWEA